MRLGFVKTFVDASAELIGEVAGPSVKMGAVSMRERPDVGGGVTTVVCLSGEAQGRVIFDLDILTALQIAKRMLGEPSPGLTPMVRSAIAELASMAIGRALSRINDSGACVTMGPPVVLAGEYRGENTAGFETMVAAVMTECGEVRINVSIQDLH
jgi:CheY-specific phosphatase CheX